MAVGFGGIDITSPEFGRAISGAFEVGERLPKRESEFGQYKSAGEERRAFLKYLADRRGGLFRLMAKTGATDYTENSFYAEWVRSGRSETYTPMAVKPISSEDVARLGEKGITPEMLKEAKIPIAPPPTAQEQITTQLEAATAAEEGLGLVDAGAPGAPPPEEALPPGIPPFPTAPPPAGQEWVFDRNTYQWVPQETTEAAQAPFRFEQAGEAEQDRFGRKKIWNPNTGRWEFPPNWNVDPATMEAGFVSPGIEAQLAQSQAQFEATQQRLSGDLEFQREQLASTEAWRGQQLTAQREERLAQLAAQPISWLQHAALSGQTPVVQEWMKPLMRPGQNLQVGQPIPGFQAGAPGAGFVSGTATPSPLGTQFANLPELRRPSAQLFARMGPTAQQQWLGFRQARTGIPPEETLFRQTQGGPPGSARGGFQQQRFRV